MEDYGSERKLPQSNLSSNAKEFFDLKRNLNQSFDSKTRNLQSSAKIQNVQTTAKLNKSIRNDENNNEIHIYLPGQSQSIEQTKIVDNSNIMTALTRLKSNYDSLKEKLGKSKVKEVDLNNDEDDIFVLQNNMNEMNRLSEKLEEKKIHVKEKNLMILLEKERKKFAKDKEKLILTYEETINRLKIELEKAISAKRELEIKVKMLEPIKFDLEKKVRTLDQEKKALEFELLKVQKEMAMIQAEVEKYRVLYNLKDKDYKALLEKYEALFKQKEALEEENKKLLPKLGKLEAENIYLKKDNERIINETQLKINEMKREINDLNLRIKTLILEITDYKRENDELKNELKEERLLKEKVMIDKMNIEGRLKEADMEIISLKRKIEELLRRPPQIIKERIPPIETIVEKPVEKTVFVDNPENIKEIEFLKNRCIGFEKEIMALKEKLNYLDVEVRDREMEITHWKGQFQQLERRRFDEIEITANERVRVLDQENEDLKYRLRFLSEELKRQSDLNQDKNENFGNQIKALKEKNQHLEEMVQYYRYNR